MARPKGSVESVQITIRITMDAQNRLRQFASDQGVNLGKIVDRLIKDHLPPYVKRIQSVKWDWDSGMSPLPSLPSEAESEPTQTLAAIANLPSSDNLDAGALQPTNPITMTVQEQGQPDLQARTVNSISERKLPALSSSDLSTDTVKQWMLYLGLNQTNLAKPLQVTSKAVSDWFVAQKIPDNRMASVVSVLKDELRKRKRAEKSN